MALAVIKVTRVKRDPHSIIGKMSLTWPMGGGKNVPFMGHTLELPWLDNLNDKSCIPSGSYPATIRTDGTKGWRIELQKTGDRKNVQIHVGNKPKDIQGCILLGKTVSTDWVGESKKAMGELKAYIASGKAPVNIRVEIVDTFARNMSAEHHRGVLV